MNRHTRIYIALAYIAIVLTCAFTAANSADILTWNWIWLTSPIWVMNGGCILLVGGAYLYEEWQEKGFSRVHVRRGYRTVLA